MSFRKESNNENIKILHQKSSLNIMAIFYRVRQACRFWWTALLASTEILIGDGHSYDSPGKVQLFNFLSEYNRKPFWHRNLGISLNLALYLHRKLCCRVKSHEPTLNEWHWKAVCELLKYFAFLFIHHHIDECVQFPLWTSQLSGLISLFLLHLLHANE